MNTFENRRPASSRRLFSWRRESPKIENLSPEELRFHAVGIGMGHQMEREQKGALLFMISTYLMASAIITVSVESIS